ncbi:unnamed protein product, partial [Allacma fusca]
IETINIIRTTTQIFQLVGIFIFSYVLNYVRRERLATVLLTVLGLSFMFLPYSSDLKTFSAMISIKSFSKGGYQAVSLIWILDLWKKAAGPYLQAEHFFLAVGVIFPPIFFGPYLSQNTDPTQPLSKQEPALTTPLIFEISPKIFLLNLEFSSSSKSSSLFIPSALCGGLILIGALLQLMLVFLPDGKYPHSDYDDLDKLELDPSSGKSVKCEEGKHESDKNKNLLRIILMLSAAIIIYSSFLAVETIDIEFFSVFLYTSPLQVPTQDGAKFLVEAALADIIATFAGIFLSTKLSSEVMIWGNMLSLLVGFALLWTAAVFLQRVFIHAAAVFIGIGLSTAVASLYYYVDCHLHLTNFTGAVLLVSSGVITFVYKLILGAYIEYTPFVYIYWNLGFVVCATVGMIWFQCLTDGTNKQENILSS